MRKTPTFATFRQYLDNMGVHGYTYTGELVFCDASNNKAVDPVTVYTMAKDYLALKLVFDTSHRCFDKNHAYTDVMMMNIYKNGLFPAIHYAPLYTLHIENGLPVFKDKANVKYPLWYVRQKTSHALPKKTKVSFVKRVMRRLGIHENDEV